jgi:hypothetical protein
MSDISKQLKFVFLWFLSYWHNNLPIICFLFYTFTIFIILLLHAINTCS